MGVIFFWTLIILEIFYAVVCFARRETLKRERAMAASALFILFLILVATPLIELSLRWYGLGALLLVQAAFGAVRLLRRQESPRFRPARTVFSCLSSCLLIGFMLMPAILFPQTAPLAPTGKYFVSTANYTWTDDTREEAFTTEDDHRKLSVQLWYPTEYGQHKDTAMDGGSVASGTYPLVIFSHGAFGTRTSNYSTYMELASHGYIVASIDHSYHAFFAKHTDGSTAIVNLDFINSAMAAQNGALDPETTYAESQKWLDLRTADMKFVLAHMAELASSDTSDPIFHSINMERIGAFGHSLGGATSAQVGREVAAVDAVIVIDGTMLGEQIDFADGKEMLSRVPYPKPIMNIYHEAHYRDAMTMQDTYANTVAHTNAVDAYQVVVQGSGHLNFTDLPLISPTLARILGTGVVDAKQCILSTNEVVLRFFNYHLKGIGPEIPRDQVF